MLTDYWVIAQLLAQVCSWFLGLVALIFSIPLIRYWSSSSGSEQQLRLERNGYLISSILRLVLGFQIVNLLLFLVTVNNRLPHIIKGAMCAVGTLGINELGYPLLGIKLSAIFVYLLFLFLHHFDNAEPAYPLSPLKYYLIPPIFLVLSIDGIVLFLYFSNITPDLIATCCSVSFLVRKADTSLLARGNFLEIGFYSLGISFCLLNVTLLFFKQKSILKILLSVIYVFSATYTLKFFFVKYIYGILGHNCLFDIFFAKYYFVGYAIFGSYYLLLGSLLMDLVYNFSKKYLHSKHTSLQENLLRVSLISLWISFFIPLGYWWIWEGQL